MDAYFYLSHAWNVEIVWKKYGKIKKSEIQINQVKVASNKLIII